MMPLLQDPEFWVVLAVLIFVIGVWKPARRAILGGLDARATRIRDELAGAQRLREEAERTLAAYQQQQRQAAAEAEAILSQDVELSKRYVGLAKKISKRTKVRIPQEKKHYLCKKCGQPLVPGKNARIRLRPANSRIIISCLGCGAIRRYPYGKPV